MDVGFFLGPKLRISVHASLIAWSEHLCVVHKQDERQMQSLLNRLKGKGLLQDADLSLGRINMHDLYREFVALEVKGILVDSSGIANRRWVCIDVGDGDFSELEVTPNGGCWQNLTRLSIWQDDYQPIPYPIESLSGIEWQHFSNVLVLELNGLRSVKGTLNLKGMKCLRSLLVYDMPRIERFEGLEGLTNLTLFIWQEFCFLDYMESLFVEQFPRSLKYLDISVMCVLSRRDVLAWCSNLCKLALDFVEVGAQLDLRNCLSLEHVRLSHNRKLQTLFVPCTSRTSRLQSLHVVSCLQLVDIQGLDQLVCLKHLILKFLALEKLPNLLSLTKLQTLRMYGGRDFFLLQIPCQLQKFHCSLEESMKAPNLSGFNQLQVLDLSSSPNLVCMSEMGDLSALRTLNLSSCHCLQRLPNLSKSRNLKELDLDGCNSLELHEEDIQALMTLPLLGFVHFSSRWNWSGIKLDLGRRKVLQYVGTCFAPPKSFLNWMEGEWEEKELGQPPIKLRE